MNIFVIGAAGMLGNALHDYAIINSIKITEYDINVNADYINYLDIRDFKKLQEAVQRDRPSIIFNLAAITDLENSEENPSECYATNYYGAENIAIISNQFRIPIVYISTAGIFDGGQDFFNCYDKPRPLNVYGDAKYLGELSTIKHNSNSYVFRAGWMMGGGLGKNGKDKKFINKIYNKFLNGELNIGVVVDKFGTPTYTVDFIENIFRVISIQRFGTYNQTNSGSASRYEVAIFLANCLGLNHKINIIPITSEEIREEYFANRPKSEQLVNFNLIQLGIEMPDWRDALTRYLSSQGIMDCRQFRSMTKIDDSSP